MQTPALFAAAALFAIPAQAPEAPPTESNATLRVIDHTCSQGAITGLIIETSGATVKALRWDNDVICAPGGRRIPATQ